MIPGEQLELYIHFPPDQPKSMTFMLERVQEFEKAYGKQPTVLLMKKEDKQWYIDELIKMMGRVFYVTWNSKYKNSVAFNGIPVASEENADT